MGNHPQMSAALANVDMLNEVYRNFRSTDDHTDGDDDDDDETKKKKEKKREKRKEKKIYRKGTEDAPQAATSAKKDAELKNKRIDAKLKQRKAKKAAKLKKKRAKMGEL